MVKSIGVKLALPSLFLLLYSCSGETQPDIDLVLEEGLQVGLIASEPLISDPVAIAFDENSAMYVVENRGYPDPAEGGKPTILEGMIAMLRDSDQDGLYDHRTDYATEFTYPNGVLPWKGGIFVTCAPDIYYCKDTTGDGVADIKEIVLTGFFDTKTAQIRTSHPTLGLDGWIYVTGGLNGGEIRSPKHPEREPVAFQNSDGRFHPETFVFEAVAGRSQFGITIDAYGRRFGCSNRHPAMQAMIEPKYLNRNPHLLFNETIHHVSKVEAEATVFPISGATITADFIPSLIGRSHQGTFTAASGTFVLNDESLGPDRKDNIFICESAQNLVQRQVVSAAGSAFESTIAIDGSEFLACKNEWFRPVFLTTGSQSGLYIVDMHRQVIDHPSYVPQLMRDKLDFESGRDMGRIYRITPQNASLVEAPQFADTDLMLKNLQSPWQWTRTTAFRLLLEQRPSEISGELRNIAANADFPESKVLALWLLSHLEEIDPDLLHLVSEDPISGVREQAVVFAAEMAQQNDEWLPQLLRFTEDQNARVRFLAALELGSFEQQEVTMALAKIAALDGADRWTRAAVLSGIGDRMSSFLQAFQDQPEIDLQTMGMVMKELGRMFGNGASKTACRNLFLEVIKGDSSQSWTLSTAAGLAEGIVRHSRGKSELNQNIFQYILGTSASRTELIALQKFIGNVTQKAEDQSTDFAERESAIAILGYTNTDESFRALERILSNASDPELHAEVVKSLTKQGYSKGGEILTASTTWSSLTPSIRSLTLSSLISKENYVQLLYRAIENDIIKTSEISSSDRQRLMENKNEKISKKAKELFEDLEGGSRMQVYERYKTEYQSGDINLGQEVFIRACSVCHSYAGEGGHVGPDLTGVKNQPPDALLLHTLVPNYEVYPNFVAVIVDTQSGESYSGWIETESDHSISLRTSSGEQQLILRSNIQSLTNTGKSLMPDGLEQTMTQQEMYDLIAFLKAGAVQ